MDKITLTEKQKQEIDELFLKSFALKEGAAEFTERAFKAAKEGWDKIKEWYPDLNIGDDRQFKYNNPTGEINLIKKVVEKKKSKRYHQIQ